MGARPAERLRGDGVASARRARVSARAKTRESRKRRAAGSRRSDFVAAVEGEVEFGEIAELGLADTKIARDLVAQGQALRGCDSSRPSCPSASDAAIFASIAGAISAPSIASASKAGAVERARRAMSEPRRKRARKGRPRRLAAPLRR